jgi:hypothetical protein
MSPVGVAQLWIVRPNPPNVNKKIPNVVVVSILAPILVAMGCWIIFGNTYISQQHHIKIALKFLPTVRSAVYSHPEFQDVIVQAWTGAGGGLAVLGTVKTEHERTELQSVIAATKPPVSVSYAVKVTPIPEFRPNTALEPTPTAP